MIARMTLPYDPYKPPAASLDAPPASDPSATVPPSVVTLLGQTRPWLKLMAILFFVLLGFGVLGLLYMLSLTRARFESMAVVPVFVLLLLYIPPAVFLWQYAGRIRRLQDGGGLPALEEALTSQKSFWKYVGILAAVVLCLYAVAFLGAGLFGTLLKR
jgi:hypothetical protein